MIAPAEPTTSTRIRTLGAAMVVTLLGQLLLGMANTFWLTVPDSGSGWKTAAPMGLLVAHITLGVALLVLAIQIARTRSATPRVMWATSRPMGAAVFHPDPESGTVSQKVLAIPRSSWPRRVTTIAAPRVRIRVDVVGSAGAIMPTRLSQRRTHHSQRYGRQWGFGLSRPRLNHPLFMRPRRFRSTHG